MSIKDAAYKTVHRHPGGAASLAPRLGMTQATLNSKVNPNTVTHKLMLDEAQMLMALTGDHSILRAQCDELGYLPPIPRVDFPVSDTALLETYTKMMAELGDFSREFHASLVDGKVTRKEVTRMRTEMNELMSACEELLSRVEQIVED